MPHVSPRAFSQRGFTLVEVLVVMVLLGVLSALLFGGLRYTARAAATGTAALDRAADVALAADFLRSALADARPFPASTDVPTIDFAGQAHHLAMIGLLPSHLARNGFHRIAISVDDGKHRLAADWAPLAPDGTRPVQPASTLIANVAGGDFAYFGTASDEKTPSWHGTWMEQSVLPLLIRLRIVYTDGTAAPDLIVAVRTAGVTAR